MIQEVFFQVEPNSWVFFLLSFFQKISWQEYFGVAFSMLQVWLASKNKAINYLFGILGILLTLYVMQAEGLYAEFVLNLYYLIMSVYGLFFWLRKNTTNTVQPISKCNNVDWLIVVGIVIISFLTFALALKSFTDSTVPIFDACVSAFAWAGMWLMAKRKLENWILLNISNLIAIPLFIYKEIYLYAFLSVFLFVVAVIGYINWKAILKKQNNKLEFDLFKEANN